jgi:hypothetical protein
MRNLQDIKSTAHKVQSLQTSNILFFLIPRKKGVALTTTVEHHLPVMSVQGLNECHHECFAHFFVKHVHVLRMPDKNPMNKNSQSRIQSISDVQGKVIIV